MKHMCGFNYRFVPAVRLAREIIDAGEVGEIRHFRGRYLQEWLVDPDARWRLQREVAGSGASATSARTSSISGGTWSARCRR